MKIKFILREQGGDPMTVAGASAPKGVGSERSKIDGIEGVKMKKE